MKQRHKNSIVMVFVLVLATTAAMPIEATQEQPPAGVHDRIDDLITCIVKTTGTLVGYIEPLSTEGKVGNLHLVEDDEPYEAVGLFEYHGHLEGHHRYLILGGYTNGADWCEGLVDDLIGDFTTKV